MNNAQVSTFHTDSLDVSRNHIVMIGRTADKPSERSEARNSRSNGLLRFIAELRRRRVCRAATMYAVALWLIFQIVELVYLELGLPDWTLKLVIVLGLLGLPIALILSWLFDITPNGLVVDVSDASQNVAMQQVKSMRPFDQAVDCGLLFAALVIGIQLAVGSLSAQAESPAQAHSQRIAVLPFRVASGNGAEPFSEGLVIELQHELAKGTGFTVIAPRDPYLAINCLSLTGAVAVSDEHVRITVMVIDNNSGEVAWSQVFQPARTDSLTGPAEIAKQIIAALPAPYRVTDASEPDHVT